MIKKLTGKNYYRITFTLSSPLALGSGENRQTDKDLLLDSRGKPYIPASSLAGAARHALEDGQALSDPAMVKKYLGYIRKATAKSNLTEQQGSRIIFYDAVLEDSSPCHITVRDSVSLDDFKTSRKGAKFDMEVLEAGARFFTFLEQDVYAEEDDHFCDFIAGLLKDQGLCFGGKSMRGYGGIRDVEIGQKKFSFTTEESLEKWLKFDVYTEKTWDPWTGENKNKKSGILLELEQAGGISIRKYTTVVKPDNELKPQPDYEQLTAHGFSTEKNTLLEDTSINENASTSEGPSTNTGKPDSSPSTGTKAAEEEKEAAVPVIPGTSWAGAFRHRMKEFGIIVDGKDSIFGYVSKSAEKTGDQTDQSGSKKSTAGGSGNKKRSDIRFSESRIENASSKLLSRNAIDRFSGGTVDKALFTEKTYFGGTCDLRISWHGSSPMPLPEKQALAASITDLHYGFLAVGGETSIGRGLFKVKKINSIEITEDNEADIYTIALQQIEETMI